MADINSNGMYKLSIQEDQDKNVSKKKTVCKYVYTVIILISYLVNYMVDSMFSSSMVDMKYMFRTSIDKVSYVYSFLGIGFLCGTLFGFWLKYTDRHIMFIVFTSLQTISYAMLGVVSDLKWLYLFAVLLNIGVSAFECGNNVWLISLWKDNYSSILHLAHFMMSFGMFLGPILESFFVLGDMTKNEVNNQYINTTIRDQINYEVDRHTNLMIPFLIAASICTIMPIGLFVMLFVDKYDPKDEKKQDNDKSDDTEHQEQMSKCSKYTLVLLIAGSLCFQYGLVDCHVFYLPTYLQLLPIDITASKGAQILALYTGCSAFGRFVSVFEAMKIRAKNMIIIHTIISILAQIILYLGHNWELLIWIGNVMLGIGYSSLSTSYFNLTEEYLKLTEKISSVFLFFSQMFMVIVPIIIGPFIERWPQFLLHIEMIMQISNIALLVFILIIIKHINKNYTK